MNGSVKSIRSESRYGFIRGEDGKDYFFHRDDVDKPTWDFINNSFDKTGTQPINVSFTSGKTARGLRASEIILQD